MTITRPKTRIPRSSSMPTASTCAPPLEGRVGDASHRAAAGILIAPWRLFRPCEAIACTLRPCAGGGLRPASSERWQGSGGRGAVARARGMQRLGGGRGSGCWEARPFRFSGPVARACPTRIFCVLFPLQSVDNYEYELPSDFEDEEIDEDEAFNGAKGKRREEGERKGRSWSVDACIST